MTDTLPRLLGVSTAAHALLAAAGLSVAARTAPVAHRTTAMPAVMFDLATRIARAQPQPVVAPRAAAAPRTPAQPRNAAPRAAIARTAPATSPAPSPSTVTTPAPLAAPPVLTAREGDGPIATGDRVGSANATAPAPATSAPGTPNGTGTAAVAGNAAFDAGAYLAGVTERVRRHRSYPAIAQEMGLEGTVEVRVELHPDGSLAAPPSIAVSCGHELLDDEALRIVRRAAPFPAMEGRDQRVTLRVPVHFHLDA